jgi:predicted PurR-regulated permease PerM
MALALSFAPTMGDRTGAKRLSRIGSSMPTDLFTVMSSKRISRDESEQQFVRRLLITVGVVALALFLWQGRAVLLLIFAAVIVAAVVRAVADPIARWSGLPSKAGLIVAVTALFALFVAASWLFGAEAATQVRMLTDSLPEAWETFRQRVSRTVVGEQLRDVLVEMQPEGAAILTRAASAMMTLGNALAGVLLAVIGGIYLASEPQFYRTGVLKLIPPARRDLVGNALDKSGRALRLWLLGQLISMAVVGVVTGVGLALIGVPSAVALALIAALAEFVPYVGPIVAAVPALLIALNQGNDVALMTLALFVVVQQIEGYVVTPIVQQRIGTLPAAVTLFAIVMAGLLFGAPGIVLAAPLTVVAYVLIKDLYVREALDTPTPIPGETESGR